MMLIKNKILNLHLILSESNQSQMDKNITLFCVEDPEVEYVLQYITNMIYTF